MPNVSVVALPLKDNNRLEFALRLKRHSVAQRLVCCASALPGFPHLQRCLADASAQDSGEMGGIGKAGASPDLRRSHSIEER